MSQKMRVGSEVLRAFSGEGDVVAWIKKVKLVAKLQGISDVASLMPLYLEGSALNLYLEMNEADQCDVAKIERRLKDAYTEGAFRAYGKLGRLRWTGEQVDDYMCEIKP